MMVIIATLMFGRSLAAASIMLRRPALAEAKALPGGHGSSATPLPVAKKAAPPLIRGAAACNAAQAPRQPTRQDCSTACRGIWVGVPSMSSEAL